MSLREPVVVPPLSTHTATVIFLHGLGDTGNGWANSLTSKKPNHVKLICPTAPTIPVTLNGGMRMPSWFDLKFLDPNMPEDEEGIKKAAQMIQEIIQNEISSGIPADRIIIGGFSQGGALALHIGLTGPVTLGGIIALSTWLPMHQRVNWNEAHKKVPILQCHGDADPLVLYPIGLLTSGLLRSHCENYEFKTYPGLAHSSSPDELTDIKEFLTKRLPQPSKK